MDMSVRAGVEEAINIIKSGGMIILTDDESRENEGDLVFAADFVTPEGVLPLLPALISMPLLGLKA